MLEAHKIIKSLKKVLKNRGYTYMDVAEHLCLSEASIKRMFSHNQISLTRLAQICEMLDLDFEGLVELMQHDQRYIQQLSQQQEAEIVKDKRGLLIAICLLNRMNVAEICDNYTLTTEEINTQLKVLQSMGLIKILNNQRIRLLVTHNFSFIPGGPIQTFFKERIASEFFDYDFSHQHEILGIHNASFSNESCRLLLEQMKRLAQLFVELEKRDASLPLAEKQAMTLVMAFRPWFLKELQSLSRKSLTSE